MWRFFRCRNTSLFVPLPETSIQQKTILVNDSRNKLSAGVIITTGVVNSHRRSSCLHGWNPAVRKSSFFPKKLDIIKMSHQTLFHIFVHRKTLHLTQKPLVLIHYWKLFPLIMHRRTHSVFAQNRKVAGSQSESSMKQENFISQSDSRIKESKKHLTTLS